MSNLRSGLRSSKSIAPTTTCKWQLRNSSPSSCASKYALEPQTFAKRIYARAGTLHKAFKKIKTLFNTHTHTRTHAQYTLNGDNNLKKNCYVPSTQQ